MILNDAEIMDVLSNTHIEEFTGGDYAMWESKLEWLQRRNIAKEQLKKVVDSYAEQNPSLYKKFPYFWQALLKEAE